MRISGCAKDSGRSRGDTWLRIREILLTFILISMAISWATFIQQAGAADGSATLYFLDLQNPTDGNRIPVFSSSSMDTSQVIKGGIEAATPMLRMDHVPAVHPKQGKAPPYFYAVSYKTVTTWSEYVDIVSNQIGKIILNGHAEVLPVPGGTESPREAWADKIAEAMYSRRLTWINVGGYPFYYTFHQSCPCFTTWGEAGFQYLMRHVLGANSVTLAKPTPNLVTPALSGAASRSIFALGEEGGWSGADDVAQSKLDRPLRKSSFKDTILMPLYEGQIASDPSETYLEGAVLMFAKPGQRFDPGVTHGFGTFVHLGTSQFFRRDNSPLTAAETDFYRGYVTVAAALWAETNRVSAVSNTYSTTASPGRRDLMLQVSPAVLGSYQDGGNIVVGLGFGLYGVEVWNMNSNDGIQDVLVNVFNEGRGETLLKANLQESKNGEAQGIKLENAYYNDANFGLLVGTVTFFLVPESAAAQALLRGIGGGMLFYNWIKTLGSYSNPNSQSGVNQFDPASEFSYAPVLTGRPSSTDIIQEFQSWIKIEVKITPPRSGWMIIPVGFEFRLNSRTSTVIVGGEISLAVWNQGAENTVTIFHDDFEGDTSDWQKGDANPSGGLDYWGPVGSDITVIPFYMWPAQVGDNSVLGGVPNTKAACNAPGSLYIFPPCYDKGMDAYLQHDLSSMNLQAYQSVTVRYRLDWEIRVGDYLSLEVLVNGLWSVLKSYPGDDLFHLWGWETPVSVSREAQSIRFRFVSNDDNNIWYGVSIDQVELQGVIQNDPPYSWTDAGNDFSTATLVTAGDYASPIYYYGYIVNDASDIADWYQFDVVSGHRLRVTLSNLAPGEQLILELYTPSGVRELGPGSDLDTTARFSGRWRVAVKPANTYGSYRLSIQTIPPGGGGGSPYLSTFDGSSWRLDNNLMPAAEHSHGQDVRDYYHVQQPLKAVRGYYFLKVSEFENAHNFIDHVRLLTVDHGAGYKVAVSPTGQVLTYSNPTPPSIARTLNGTDVAPLLRSPDDIYYKQFVGDSLFLYFTNITIRENAKVLIRSDPAGCSIACPKSWFDISLQASNGAWIDVADIFPRKFWSYDIVDLSQFIPLTGSKIVVKIGFDNANGHQIDFVGLDTTPQQSVVMTESSLTLAVHSQYGDVTRLVASRDGNYAEIIPGQHVVFTFKEAQPTAQARDFIFITDGHYVPVGR